MARMALIEIRVVGRVTREGDGPFNADTAVMQLTPGGQVPLWTGFAVFIGFVVLALAAATILVEHRDA